MSDKPIVDRLRVLAETHPRLQQFGQNNDDLVHNGSTACTHTVCQFLSLAWNGTIPTLNEVNRLAGMPDNAVNEATRRPRGMRPGEFQTFLTNARIPMKIVRGLPFTKVLDASNAGPVMYGMRYGSAPVRSRSHPNGATQKGGPGIANIRHAVVMLGFLAFADRNSPVVRMEVYRKEPNHGSPNRPERPPYDTISSRQARIEYEDYHNKLKEPLYAAVPTRALQVIGTLAAPKPAQAPPLVLTGLQPFSGIATIKGDGHSAVQLADREFIHLPDGAQKRVVALGRLVPRLPGPAGNRTHVALVGDEAAVLLRSAITLTTDGGVVVPPPASEADEEPPPGPALGVPDGDPVPDAVNHVSNGAIPPD